MSDTSWSTSVPRTSPSGSRRRAPGGSGELIDAVLPLVYGWLPRQRWFAGKGRPITDIRLTSATELSGPGGPGTAGAAADGEGSPGLLHLLLRVEQEAPEGGSPQGGDEAGSPPTDGHCYQLLLGTTHTAPRVPSAAMIGRIDGGPHDGLLVFDALHDPRLAGQVLGLMSQEARVGPLGFRRAPGTDIPTRLEPRVGTAEQSNTSVVFGDALILKVFRQVSPGINPDLELTLALAAVGNSWVPAPLGWIETNWPDGGAAQGEPVTLGLLQRFLPGSADGWELALASVPDGDFTAESYLLGQATAEVHTALARALPVVVLGEPQIRHLAAGMARRLDTAAAAVPDLRPYRTALRAAFDDLAALGREGRTMAAQRIHGDLHLGQVLRTTDGWVLLDFEGEPAQPIAERRRPQPSVRDVAAMLRSFDYAARHHGAGPAAERWAERNRTAFCSGYAAVSASAEGQDPAVERVLMRAFEIDKAVYEALYEARHRPTWLPIPMSAIERLAGGGPS
jgi:maltokinase